MEDSIIVRLTAYCQHIFLRCLVILAINVLSLQPIVYYNPLKRWSRSTWTTRSSFIKARMANSMLNLYWVCRKRYAKNMMEELINNKPYGELLSEVKSIIEQSRWQAYQSVNTLLVRRNWYIGKQIAEKELNGADRADYGAQVISRLADDLTSAYGKGFDYSSLYKFVRFYKAFPNILDSVSPKLNGLLSWTHYRILLQVSDDNARTWYAKEASEQTWSVRTLQRNISSQYYYRLLKSQHKDLVEKEMLQKTVPLQDKLEYIKNPVLAEFLGFSQNTDYLESTLEKAIISNIEISPGAR